MSIAIGFIGEDGILLATDSLLSIFDDDGNLETTMDYSQKLWQLTPSSACTSIGSQEGYRKLLVDKLINHSISGVPTNSFDKLCEGYTEILKTEHLKRIKGFRSTLIKSVVGKFVMQMLIAGYDESKTPRMISLDASWLHGYPFAQNKVKSCRIHGGGTIGTYWLKRLHLENEQLLRQLYLKSLKRLAVFIIQETAFYFPWVGGKIQMATITKEKGFEPVEDAIIENIQKELDEAFNVNDFRGYLVS